MANDRRSRASSKRQVLAVAKVKAASEPVDPVEPKVPGKCNAHTRGKTGRCGQPAGWGTPHPGFGACKFHLGNTRNHITEWREYLAALVPNALRVLADGLDAEDMSAEAKLRYAKDVLDRAGLAARVRLEHTGSDGGPVEVDVSVSALRAKLAEVRELEAGEG